VTALRGQAWLGLVVPLVLLALWEYIGLVGGLPRYLVAPSVILRQLAEMTVSGEILGHIGASLFRSFTALAIGAGCGVAAGLAAGTMRPVERFYEPIVSLTYPVPKIAALPIIFAWFGLGDASKIVIITASAFYPLYIAALYGAKSTRRDHIWAARNMGATRITVFRRIVLPSALPEIFNGLRVALALSFIVVVVAELIAAQTGLGYLIGMASHSLRFDIMYVSIVVIGIIGLLADRLLLAIRARVLAGQIAATEARR
jgi:ABC-type nitrate/sulfonate/bicarbonate transport system permease component